MSDQGLIEGPRKRITPAGELPPVCVIEVTGRDADGELLAEPESWDREKAGEPPQILLLPRRRSAGPAPGVGDRLLTRLDRLADSDVQGRILYQGRPIKQLERGRGRLLGIYRALPGGRGVVDPVDRKQLKEWPVPEGDTGGAQDGELVRFEFIRAGGRYGLTRVRIIERLGNPEAQGAVSLIAIHEHGLRHEFSDAQLAEAESLSSPGLEDRADLRQVPLVTIDPADARDHDDAVWAAPDDDLGNEGGWVVTVAIADVAWFIRPESVLDREAQLRGNSAYFPDRVVPMLPEKISADLCSLREGEDRSCLAVRMVLDANGNKKSHRFARGMMRSAARLSYDQAQAAIDGRTDAKTGPLLEPVLKPLWGAYKSLARARDARAPLDLDLPERKVLLDDAGRISDIVVPPRLEAHRLIEEFMIQANVAAAETLEAQRSPLVYRVHDAPSKEKLVGLTEFLETLGIKLAKTGQLRPEHFNRILDRARRDDLGDLVSEMVLRSQAQAEYSATKLGHFGLNLRRYAHFTSPIRRYADLTVHRALIRALSLGAGGLTDGEISRLGEIAGSISKAERLAMAAERQTVDRLVAGWLTDRIGTAFSACVSGVVPSGLFVRLEKTGADGFVPASSIIGDFYRLDERHQALIGDDTRLAFQLGDTVEVRLVEAIPSAGALRFEMLSEGRPAPATARGGTRERRKTPVRGKKGHRRRR
jgi:ribonuclease R